MIATDLRGQGQRFESRLLVTAQRLANARGNMIAASRAEEGAGWRSAPFLWPLIERN